MARIASGQVVAPAQGIWPEVPEFSIQHTDRKPEGSAGAKGRTKPPQAISKPPQSHPKALVIAHIFFV